jgi:hypothetical protein
MCRILCGNQHDHTTSGSHASFRHLQDEREFPCDHLLHVSPCVAYITTWILGKLDTLIGKYMGVKPADVGLGMA